MNNVHNALQAVGLDEDIKVLIATYTGLLKKSYPPSEASNQGRPYFNLFDAMYDAYFAAQSHLGGSNVEIVVSESGWPSTEGDVATTENAGTYYRNLISHVKSSSGTPARPGRSIETYLFAMFDENMKPGKETEKHFGVFFPDQRPKYQLSF
uniref:Putative glycoside hydrolase family 17 n=1 Tax=Helianthus annuus TaxID=4232 RepID=A0A251TH58_HELAN